MEKQTVGWQMLVTFFGLVVALIAYFWAHKPLDPALIASLGGAFLDLFTISLIVSLAGGLGRRVLLIPTLQLEKGAGGEHNLSRAERLALEGTLGLGILGMGALILGLVGFYKPVIFWLMIILLAMLLFRHVLGWSLDLFAVLHRALQPPTRWTRFLALTIVIFLGMALLHALAPPTAYDSLNYHLLAPKRYLEAGRILPQPDNHFLGFPQGVEVLYGLAMGLFGRDTSAAPLHYAFGLFGLLAVGGLLKRRADLSTAYLAVALLVSAFSLWLLFGWPYVDLAMFTYGALALSITASFVKHPLEIDLKSPPYGVGRGVRAVNILLLGIIAGLAMGVKYTGVGLLFALGFFLLWNAPRQILRNGLLLVLVTGVIFLPWGLKGLLLYQNPVYPFAFGGLNWDAGRAYTFSTPGTGLLGSADAWQLIILPLAATVFGVEKAGTYSFTVGPWLLTAPLLLIFGWRWLGDSERKLARSALLLALPILIFWIALASLSSIGVQTRLVIMGLPAASVLAALGFNGLSKWPRKPLDVGFIARALLVLTLTFAFVDVLRDTVRARIAPYLMATLSRTDYRRANLGVYVDAMQQLRTLPEGSQVRFMYEQRTYDCPPNVICIGDILFDHWPRPLRQGMTPDEGFQSWKDAGDDYILLFNPGYRFSAEDTRFITENALFPSALENWMMPIWSDAAEGYTLYTWK
ncbi:MAG: hypothetical protein K8L97_30465 [Anaerolineae bacterium]|nr:hypothetical protein [Anaerolineae bacterium]